MNQIKLLQYKYYFILIISLTFYAYVNSFIQDDAFITFRYSKNLALYGELNWNLGDSLKVEGYSNFLWMLIMVIPEKLNVDVQAFSKSLGLLLTN